MSSPQERQDAHDTLVADTLAAVDGLPAPARALAVKWRPAVELAGRAWPPGSAAGLWADFVRDLGLVLDEYWASAVAPLKPAGVYHKGSGV